MDDATPVRYPFPTGDELLAHAARAGLRISDVMLANELSWRTEAEVRARPAAHLAGDAGVRGARLRHRRRAARRPQGAAGAPPTLRAQLEAEPRTITDPLRAMDWVTLYALAVNEENAAGGRVVTAPTNGAAGIVPAVLHYYTRFVPGADRRRRGPVPAHRRPRSACCSRRTPPSPAPRSAARARSGSACSMAAGGLAEVLGGTPEQVENAAEIGIEHNLGLTCDPVGGLVQIPCIERNAVGVDQGDHRRPHGPARRRQRTTSRWTRRSRRCARPAPT